MPILRFAPSPNGYLHLGHAYSALYTDLWARQLGGAFLLRLEDTDITRCKPEFARAIAERLWSRGLLYHCDCTRQEIAERSTATDPDGAPIYDGKCKRHGLAGGGD